jgi:hypothetical protein
MSEFLVASLVASVVVIVVGVLMTLVGAPYWAAATVAVMAGFKYSNSLNPKRN